MGTKIQDLNISSFAKHALQNAGFTMVSELIGQNYISLVPKFPPHYNILAIIQELNPLGYLLPPENEKSIGESAMEALGKSIASGSPSFASLSILGPPG